MENEIEKGESIIPIAESIAAQAWEIQVDKQAIRENQYQPRQKLNHLLEVGTAALGFLALHLLPKQFNVDGNVALVVGISIFSAPLVRELSQAGVRSIMRRFKSDQQN